VQDLAEKDPTMLIAYIHSMYMALLAGGQIIKKIVQKSLGMSGDEGLSIFEFDTVNSKELRALITDSINNMEFTRDQKDRIIREKIAVFGMNNSIVNSIQPSLRNFGRIGKFVGLSMLVFCVIVLLIAFAVGGGISYATT